MSSNTRRRALEATIGLMALGGVAMLFPGPALAESEVPPAQPAPAGAALSVSPSPVAPGGKVTVSGNKCRSMDTAGGPQVTIGNPPDGPFLSSTPWPTVDATGRWKTTITIPAHWSPGTYLVRGVCFNAPGSDTGFKYPNIKLTVKGRTPSVKVTPRYTG